MKPKLDVLLQNKGIIILGVDPGTVVMGFSVILVKGQAIQSLETDVLKLGSVKDLYKRLHMIHDKICQLISKHQPDSFAIEAPFFGKNVQSMLKLGRAQGVAIAAAMQAGLEVVEYSPKKIKQSVTGNGNADKEQVWKMLQQIVVVKDDLKYYDASDAMAVAVCHHFQHKFPKETTVKKTKAKNTKTSWEQFIQQNPGRVKQK